MREYIVENELKAEVYTIGYEPQGEGIVIKIIADGITKFCVVIDCFEIEKQNQTLSIIKDEKVDLICLTHPDYDHCNGLEKILRLANSNTKVLYPDKLLTKSYLNQDVEKVIKMIAKFTAMNRNNSKKPELISCIGNQDISSGIRFMDVKSGGKYKLEIKTYSPITSIIDRRDGKRMVEKNYKEIENNEFSIMMSLGIGTLKLLFCGDVEDDTIIEINKRIDKGEESFFYDIIDYVKIPHHASSGSKEMFNLLSNVTKVSNSVSTVYRLGKLPNEEILDRYQKKRGKVFCTSNSKPEENIEKYGIVKHCFDILNKTVSTELMANASEYCKQKV